ncbi:MAG: L,D-transpeptidase [Roseiarcus sp.]|jgi:lipoprotein-anchoring transpeptidase ErfK/SrfK
MRRASRLFVCALLGFSAAGFAAAEGLAAPARSPAATADLTAAQSANGGLAGAFIEFLTGGRFGAANVAPTASAEPPVATAPSEPADADAAPSEEYRRQEVDYSGPGGPGAIVIDTAKKFLFLIKPNGRAIRYGVGVGRPGFEWSGVELVSRKAEWPDWTPPPQMLLRRPDLPTHMDGGPDNPLGARALYLGSSMFRIHGTNEPETIGQNVSSGCIRMMNEDVIDLYDRVRVGAKVIVL